MSRRLGTTYVACLTLSLIHIYASRYTQEQLASVRHDHELVVEKDFMVLCIDGRMSGLGSGSCGPQLSELYQVNEERFSCAFMIEFLR